MTNAERYILGFFGLVVLGFVAWGLYAYSTGTPLIPDTGDGVSTSTPRGDGTDSGTNTGNDDPPTFSTVNIALLDTEQTTDGPVRGCDKVVMVERSVTPTQAPLTAALEALFALNSERVSGLYHFISKTNDTLSFDRAVVDDGTAHVYLTGSLTGLAGVCDDPRARIQIEETALQFSTVDRVQIYLNGSPTDLQPNEM